MKENIIKNKSFAFSVRIVKLSQFLQNEKKEFVLSKQLLRSGTSIGAMIRESEHAESNADFIHKLSIAQKEANETQYWIELLCAIDLLNKEQFQSIDNDITELSKILSSIIITSKNKPKK